MEEAGAREKAKREQVLEGARRVFLRDGFAAVSTDLLAREARVSKRTLYAYYPSKEELFVDVLRGLTIDDPRTKVLDFLQTVSPGSLEELRQVLIELAEKMLTSMMNPDYLRLLRIIIADSHRFPQLAELVRSTIPQQGLKEVGCMLQRARAKGVPLEVDTESLTRLFLGPLLTYVLIDGLLQPDRQPQLPAHDKLLTIVHLYLKAIVVHEQSRKDE
ncbi:TetR/AcrR family transcriptional regulator [Tengunoibacter tsumagoiensis]|uniref:HTH tetR-type domain-containing protein n=1 Tax=Tengunoibacter tsumagoiensis TaxID=2014871 RepID=A0A402A763_9CHLR|nr:TetR/AcrR family transcriptional regulator [Tengunoibacter tsumagoiensis]GCE14831.1 hypothetical protein KTT_46900 [Tengunoibacter tsumagoiensis]